MLKQPAAKFTEHGMVKARVSEVQAQQILPVYAAADGVSSLAIRKAFGELQDRGEGKAHRSFCGLSVAWVTPQNSVEEGLTGRTQ